MAMYPLTVHWIWIDHYKYIYIITIIITIVITIIITIIITTSNKSIIVIIISSSIYRL